MKVVLTSGFDVEISLEAFRLYKKKSGLDLFAYFAYDSWDDDYVRTTDFRRIDDDAVPDYEPMYVICDKDLGRVATQEDVYEHRVDGLFDDRTDPILISVLEELGGKALGYTGLSIAEIPDDIEWHIERDLDTHAEWVEEGPPRERRESWYGEPIKRIWD